MSSEEDRESDVKKKVDATFLKIKEATSLDDIKDLNKEFEEKLRLDIDKYPKIEFEIAKEEADTLSKLLDSDGKFKMTNDELSRSSAITKLLYSVLWKQGDLPKLKHVIEGIKEAEDQIEDRAKGLVFYQFGKYLRNRNEPILDQHVFRAFAIYKTAPNDLPTIQKLRKKTIIRKIDWDMISSYRDWLDKHTKEDYRYEIDRVLFALGKWAKMR